MNAPEISGSNLPSTDTTIAALEQWGERALRRRIELGLPINLLARILRVSTATLMQWECSLPKATAHDAAWELALQVPSGWLRESRFGELKQELQLANGTRPIASVQLLASSMAALIRDTGDQLSDGLARARPWEKKTAAECRAACYFSVRFGVASEAETTFKAIAKRYGVSSERVRQVFDKMIGRARQTRFTAPLIDTFLLELERILPASISRVDNQLRLQLGEALSILGADRFCREILNRPLVKFANARGAYDEADRILLSANTVQLSVPDMIGVAVTRMNTTCGAVNHATVLRYINKRWHAVISSQSVVSTCQALAGFEWLDASTGWFWFGNDADNPALLAIRKLVSCAEFAITAEEIHHVLERIRRYELRSDAHMAGLAKVPRAITEELLNKLSRIAPVDARRRTNEATSILSSAEICLTKIAGEFGGVISKRDVERNLARSDEVNCASFVGWLDRSPLFEPLDHGLYCRRGVHLTEQVLLDARGRNDLAPCNFRLPVVADDDGYYAVQIRLSAYMVKQRICSLPASLSRVVPAGEYELEEWPGRFVTLTGLRARTTSNALGLVRELLAMGFVAGDDILLSVNAATRKIRTSRLHAN